MSGENRARQVRPPSQNASTVLSLAIRGEFDGDLNVLHRVGIVERAFEGGFVARVHSDRGHAAMLSGRRPRDYENLTSFSQQGWRWRS
jgi:hypothetical protein